MKYVITMAMRANGSGAEREVDARRVLAMWSKWAPPESLTFHLFVDRIDSGGMFAVVETDNPVDLIETTAKFAPYLESQIHPVVDIGDGAVAVQRAIEFRESIT